MNTRNNDRRQLTTFVVLTIGVAAASSLAGCGRSRSDGADPAVATIASAVIVPQVASFSVPASVDFKPLAAAASSALTVSDRAELRDAAPNTFVPSTSTGTSTSIYGNQVKVGTIKSLPAVTVGASSTVSGSITSGSTITGAPPGTTVLPNQPLAATTFKWTVPFNTSTTGVTLNTGTRVLAPGSYGTVQVNGGRLIMNPGTYFIDTLTLNSGTTLTLNNASAPIFLYVRSGLAFRTAMTGTAENLLLVYFGTSGTAIESPFRGTVVAPNASIRMGVGGTLHTGAVFAKTIVVDPDVKLTQKTFARWDLIPFDVGVAPTLNCVAQLDATKFGAVFGYNNVTGTTITLGAGPHNFFSPGAADRGQPILFVPGAVPIASFQTFAAGSSLSLKIGDRAVTASASSPACPADLRAALTQLYVDTPDSLSVRQAIANLVRHPRFATWAAAVRANSRPQVSPFQSSILDALDLIVANADLLADPATLTAQQLARLPSFRTAVLANAAVQRMRVAGDALKGNGGATVCDALKQINRLQPPRNFLPAQPDSLFAQTLALSQSVPLANLQSTVAGVARGPQSGAVLGASGLALAGLIPENELIRLQLEGPIPTGWFGGVVGAIVGGVAGFIGGGPVGGILGAIAGGLAGSFTEDEIAKKNHPCDVDEQCFNTQQCVAGFCTDIGRGINGEFLTGLSCPQSQVQCLSDSECLGPERCVHGCCTPLTIIISQCPGNTCSSDAECTGNNNCQNGCCVGPCGVAGTTCFAFTSTVCSIPDGTGGVCPSERVCRSGCCDPQEPR